MRRPSLKNLKFPDEAISKAGAAGHERLLSTPRSACSWNVGFGAASMDDLASAACGALRTLYNQFASKEEIFREMLLRVPGIETPGQRRGRPSSDRGAAS
jgi:AcrR family transcriptional regulator